VAQPSVSKHLKILEEAGLVESSKDGMWMNYRLSINPETLYAKHMLEVLGNWVNDDREIIHAVKQARILNRCDITGRCS
jgi:ArsR family transcriptional regulator